MANKGAAERYRSLRLLVKELGINGVTLTVGGTAITSLTDNSGGTANDTLQDIGVTYAEAEVANNFADCAAKINAILAALRTAGIIVT